MIQTNFLPKKYSIFIIVCCLLSPAAFSSNSIKGSIEYCFTPGGNCTEKIVDAIHHAQKTLWIQAYQFTSLPISEAVIAAKRRGVDVRIILDKTQYTQKPNASAVLFKHQGIPVWIDNKVSIAHNKIIIVDNQKVISGSFNFSKAAQTRNAENVLIIQSTELAKVYVANWRNRQAASLVLEDYMTLKNIKHKHSETATWLNKAIDMLDVKSK